MQGYKTPVQILNTAVGGKSTFFGTSSANKNLSLQQLKLALFFGNRNTSFSKHWTSVTFMQTVWWLYFRFGLWWFYNPSNSSAV